MFSDLSQEDVKKISTAAPSIVLFCYPRRDVSYKGNTIMNFPRRWAKLEKNSHQRALCKYPYSCLLYASAQTPIFLPTTVLPFVSLVRKINSSVKHGHSVSFHISPNHYSSSYNKSPLLSRKPKYATALFQQPKGASCISNIVCLPFTFSLEGPPKV